MLNSIIAFFTEYYHIVVNKFESVTVSGVLGLEDFVNKHEFFAVAIAMLLSLALFVFSIKSYKSYKILLPLAAVVFGSWGASKFCPRIINYFFPSVQEYIDPRYLAGIICAVILAVICIKHLKCSTTIVGLAFGYFVVLRFAKVLFRTSDIFKAIVELSGNSRVIPAFYNILAHVCMLLAAYIFYKWFKTIYTVGASMFASAASFGVIVFFATRITTFTVKATLIAGAIGAVVGLIFAIIQLKGLKDEYNELACSCCEKHRKAKAAKAANAAPAPKKAKASKEKAPKEKAPKKVKASKKDKKAAKAAA